MIKELLAERDLISIMKMNDGSAVSKENWQQRRCEMMDLLSRYSYGYTPSHCVHVTSAPTQEDESTNHGSSFLERRELSIHWNDKTFSFPFVIYKPAGENQRTSSPLPVILYLSGHGLIGDLKEPPSAYTNEHGYILVKVFFADIVNDHHYGDYSDGLAAFFGMNQPREGSEWGKIGMWAYGASRVMDYLMTRSDMDHERIILAGHSRLGKTVLWAAAQDERFSGIIDNASGYGGAATSKHGTGERVSDFLRAGSWDWFCENFKEFSGEKEDSKPYDQSMLLALLAPRLYCIGTADADTPSDPVSIYLSALHASSAWELFHIPGLCIPDRLPAIGDIFHDGHIGFHMRSGTHALTHEDWGYFLDFYDSKWNNHR